MLLHAKARWPSAVHLSLWPYEIRMDVHIHSTVPVLLDRRSRLELFSGTNTGFRMKNNHAFACSVFTLQNSLAAGTTIPKWSPRSCLGLNLGPSPNHTRNVNRVLNLNTGLVSPQFHRRYNDFFETTKHSERDILTSSSWKQLAGFTKYDGTSTMQDRLSSADQHLMPIGTNLPSSENEHIKFVQEFVSDDDISLSGDSIGTIQVPEGDIVPPLQETKPTPTAGISSRSCVRKMSPAMQDSVSQRSFYGDPGVHYRISWSVSITGL